MSNYTTQMDAARKGIITKEIETVAKKENMEFLAVVLGSPAPNSNINYRDSDCAILFDYGFENYDEITKVDPKDVINFKERTLINVFKMRQIQVEVLQSYKEMYLFIFVVDCFLLYLYYTGLVFFLFPEYLFFLLFFLL